MTKKRVIAILLVAMLGTVWFLTMQLASAADCGARISGSTQVLASAQPTLNATLGLFQDAGADTHVVVYDSDVPVKAYIQTTLAGCNSWQGQAGHAKSSLLVFFMNARNRHVDVLYGSKWAPAFQDSGNYSRIWSSPLSGHFGKVGLGPLFESRLNDTYTAIIPGNPRNGVPSPSTDWGHVALRVIGAVVLACLMALFVLWLHKKKPEREQSPGVPATT